MRKTKITFYYGFQTSLFSDRQGFKYAMKIKVWRFYREWVWIIKKNQAFYKQPQVRVQTMPFVEMNVKVPTGKVLEPEDIEGVEDARTE